MKNSRVFVVALGIAIFCSFSACTYRVTQIERGFASVETGAPERAVIEKLGSPDVVDTSAAPFVVYASALCSAPCVRRLWWEHPVLKGVEAWSVELGSAGNVLTKSHWVSP
jgi:hypothetical protein